jgi:hypothetical protein
MHRGFSAGSARVVEYSLEGTVDGTSQDFFSISAPFGRLAKHRHVMSCVCDWVKASYQPGILTPIAFRQLRVENHIKHVDLLHHPNLHPYKCLRRLLQAALLQRHRRGAHNGHRELQHRRAMVPKPFVVSGLLLHAHTCHW